MTRPDSVGFTRRVLARAPGAAIVLFGAEDPRVAAAAVAAGARGVIRASTHDLVSVVAKALLLLVLPVRPAGRRDAATGGSPRPAATRVRRRRARRPVRAPGGGDRQRPGGRGVAGRCRRCGGPTDVPVQRGDLGEAPTRPAASPAGQRRPAGRAEPEPATAAGSR